MKKYVLILIDMRAEHSEKVKEEFVATTGKNLTFDKKGQEQGYQYIEYKTENETFTILYWKTGI